MKTYLILVAALTLAACGESSQDATVRRYMETRAVEKAREAARPMPAPSEAAARCYNDPQCGYSAAVNGYVPEPTFGPVEVWTVPTWGGGHTQVVVGRL